MQKGLESTRPYTETGRGTLPPANIAFDETDIDPLILARLDVGLLKCLQNLGTSKQRICSALCLSYSEYDSVLRLMQNPDEA